MSVPTSPANTSNAASYSLPSLNTVATSSAVSASLLSSSSISSPSSSPSSSSCRIKLKDAGIEAVNMSLGPILTYDKLAGLFYLLPKLNNCVHINISHNQIRKIELEKSDVSSLEIEKLKSLDLSNNKLYEVDGRNIPFPYLTKLNISNNNINRLVHFELLFHLKELNLRNNRIHSLRMLRGATICQTLEKLDLSRNMIRNVDCIKELVQMQGLQDFDVTQNYLSINLSVEAFCMLSCKSLLRFNGNQITEDVRATVQAWAETDTGGKLVQECADGYRRELCAVRGPCNLCTTQGFNDDETPHTNSHTHTHNFWKKYGPSHAPSSSTISSSYNEKYAIGRRNRSNNASLCCSSTSNSGNLSNGMVKANGSSARTNGVCDTESAHISGGRFTLRVADVQENNDTVFE